MPGVDIEEKTLVIRASKGDAEAFGQIYMRHLDAIYRYVYFRVQDNKDAEDLTEQIFLKAWESLPGYKDKGYPFSSWLYRIAHNLVIDFHRRNKFIQPMPPVEEMNWANESPSTLEQLIKTEELNSLTQAIAKLPDTQQEVIILRFVEGLSHEQVATIIQKSSGACRTIQYRALATLQEILAAEKAGIL
ncbi:MAG: RNA polymerase sigma factor [Chloroflexi bacterium]|nr:MAG: RNA polymerase sigma factor [Chloroflexota bacterium]